MISSLKQHKYISMKLGQTPQISNNQSPSFLPLSFIISSLIVRHLFICPCDSHRHLFVICSSFLRLLFVFCSSFVRPLFVFCSSFVRLTFPLLHSLSFGEGWGEDILFVFSLSACRATTARAARTVFYISFL